MVISRSMFNKDLKLRVFCFLFFVFLGHPVFITADFPINQQSQLNLCSSYGSRVTLQSVSK